MEPIEAQAMAEAVERTLRQEVQCQCGGWGMVPVEMYMSSSGPKHYYPCDDCFGYMEGLHSPQCTASGRHPHATEERRGKPWRPWERMINRVPVFPKSPVAR